MEPLTRRIVLRIYTEKQDQVVAFYGDLVGLRIAKDVTLITGERWVALVKHDNIGVQFHIHPCPPRIIPRPFHAELSIGSGEYDAARKRFQDAGYSIREFTLPYADGFSIDDPVGNEITLSWWGELEHDEEYGWDSQFLDYDNCAAPAKRDVNMPNVL
ncbi:MAG: hypothetical protein JWL59_4872 [Chthoniobacteraceae bacterium]|nr:hypothetical protein [Chthoniobacteraceae bacterium]